MQPAIMLSPILDLHDARYCAAVGITHLGFHMNGTGQGLSPAEVAEILDWLSGPVGVAEFGHEAPHEVNEIMVASKCAMASLPASYDIRLISSISFPVVIRLESEDLQLEDWRSVLGVDNFLLLSNSQPNVSFGSLNSLGIGIERVILTVDSLEEAHELRDKFGGMPYAISLGGFVKGADGRIDYGNCDDFLDGLQELQAV